MKCAATFSMLALTLLLALAGCQQPARPPGFSLDRGAQLLAGGSPKSAIPFLTRTVAGVPDGPDPVALLSLAYALDLQHERAILQAEKVRRTPTAPPSWEAVAVGIARMTENRPADAVVAFERVGPQTPAAAAAQQWRILAQLLNGKQNDAVQSLETMSGDAAMGTSATLWLTIIHEQAGRKDLAAAALRRCAASTVSASGQMALRGDLADADGQTLYDAGLAAVAQGDLAKGRELLSRVQEHTFDGCDTPLWLALIGGIREDWQTARNQLSAACETGAAPSRGLASQLFSVVCALEDRPTAVIEYTLLGQRMMGRNGEPAYIHEQPQPEPVWGSDQMH
jgi:hypothetical protein